MAKVSHAAADPMAKASENHRSTTAHLRDLSCLRFALVSRSSRLRIRSIEKRWHGLSAICGLLLLLHSVPLSVHVLLVAP